MAFKPQARRQANPTPRVDNRPSAHQRGYTTAWSKSAKTHLEHEPLCRECLKHGDTTPATCVDHIVPHRGDQALFWDTSNWQSLCASCHSRKTAAGR